MRNRFLVRLAIVMGAIVGVGAPVWGQQGTPDIILYNGKIVTVDNHEVNANLGTIAQAVAVRVNTIQAVGNNAQIRALAGPNTKIIDLKGRTVIPGLSVTHDHPMDWDPLNPLIVKKAVNDSIHIERFLWKEPPEQQVQMFPRVLDEAVQKAKPGQWVRISMLYGKDYRGQDIISGALGRQITKPMLDMVAPNNPVMARAGFTGMLVNQKAIDTTNSFYRQWDPNWQMKGRDGWGDAETTGLCGTCYRDIEQDVLYPLDVYQEIVRLGTSWWAGYGLTTNGSAIYNAGALNAYNNLDRKGQMEIRVPWSWRGQTLGPEIFGNPYFVAALNVLQGRGSDYLWMVGVWPPGGGGACTTLPGKSPEVKQREGTCRMDPVAAARQRKAFYNSMRGGNRFAGSHTGGDKDIDYILEIIEQAGKDAGMTLEDIRAKRHVYDHLAMSPRPDQLPRIKNLGMQLGGWDMYIWEGSAQEVLRDYGEEGAQWVVPRKSILDAGVRQSVEIDRPLGYTDLTFFTVLYAGITRKDQNGKINAPQQAVSREAMLKSATLSGAYYVMREDKLGSLEAGKFADLVVLDRDYLTIPVDDIPNIRVLMTMLGGKVVHLVPSLAKEVGMQPAGSQVELGGLASQW